LKLIKNLPHLRLPSLSLSREAANLELDQGVARSPYIFCATRILSQDASYPYFLLAFIYVYIKSFKNVFTFKKQNSIICYLNIPNKCMQKI
jgi:hypothetical protein